MAKTFYSVDYTGAGFFGTHRRWFDNLEDAKAFAKRDYADAPVKHTYKRADSIAEIEMLIAYQEL